MASLKLTQAQVTFIGRVLAHGREQPCRLDTLGIWRGQTYRTFRVLVRKGLLKLGRRRRLIGLGGYVETVRVLAAGRRAYDGATLI